jgi:23S rRNA (guanine2445-N2)-methyltransferase / 23S rRNA (guanine2069-N7)-methyltransferase
MNTATALFATCPKGLELLLADELRALGARDVHEKRAGVEFSGTLDIAYRACLWSRLASRILLPIQQFPARTPEELYAGVRTIEWDEHIAPEGTVAVDFTTTVSAITHSHYGALKVKDAVVDQMRDKHGVRPWVDTERPDLRINVYLHRDEAIVSIDLSGEALHRRGYRGQAGEAPLKENLAAAILLRANWPAIARDKGPLIDLMCGSGTFLVEAALMAADIAPGLERPYFGFFRWRGHDVASWDSLLDEARARRDAGLTQLPTILGYDQDSRVVRAARDNISGAGLDNYIAVEERALNECVPEGSTPGLVLANPPYGERMGTASQLPALYGELGTQMKTHFGGWRGAVFTGNPDLGKHMGLRAHRMHTLWNGAIECRLLHFDITQEWHAKQRDPSVPREISDSGKMFENRLRKDLKHFGKWARRQDIGAYRVYDADLHEYNLAIDIYESDKRYVHVQEYEAPDTIDPMKAKRRLDEALYIVPQVLEIPPEQVFFKQRRRQKGGTQYEKISTAGRFYQIQEGACVLQVNFTDYLDTGLFLDHRQTRAMIGELSKGKRFLNLFGYTGSATVHAALGGAIATTTVDMSNTYLDWAQRNLDLNNAPRENHELIQADVLQWLDNQQNRYDLIFLDPPTFSRSKRMEGTLDVQRDHVDLIGRTIKLLAPGGILIFSTNLRRFRIDAAALGDVVVEDITRKTIPMDFERNPKIHQCFRITLKR